MASMRWRRSGRARRELLVTEDCLCRPALRHQGRLLQQAGRLRPGRSRFGHRRDNLRIAPARRMDLQGDRLQQRPAAALQERDGEFAIARGQLQAQRGSAQAVFSH